MPIRLPSIRRENRMIRISLVLCSDCPLCRHAYSRCSVMILRRREQIRACGEVPGKLWEDAT